MAADPKILNAVLKKRKEEIAENQAEISIRKQLLCEKNPELSLIYSELSNTMAELSRLIFQNSENADILIDKIREKNQALLSKRGQLLEKLGYPKDYLTDKPTCPLCSDSLFIGSKPCECVTSECILLQNKEISSIIGIGENKFPDFKFDFYSDKRDEDYQMSPRENIEYIYSQCLEFAENFGGSSENLLLCGSSGLGKTFLAGCIAREISQKGFSVVYDTAVNIFSCMERRQFGNETDQIALQLKRISVCDLLIIDDLGTEMQTSFTVSAFYSLINSRLMSKRPVIVITALTDESEIRRKYGPQNTSRLFGEFRVLNFFGNDIRFLKKQMH